MKNALVAGAVGAVTTNLLHELVRRTVPAAPRVDLLGMQAYAKLVASRKRPPVGRALYARTLAADLLSNTAYFSLAGAGSRDGTVARGLLAGALAGIGAVVLPRPLGLSAATTGRTALTKALTVGLYTAGGLAAGIAARS